MHLSFSLWRRESWRAFLRQRTVLLPTGLSVGFLIATWLLAVAGSRLGQQSFVLRYSFYFGANWLTDPAALALAPLAATVAVLVDFSLAYFLRRGSVVLEYVCLWSGTFVAVGFLWLTWLLVGFNS